MKIEFVRTGARYFTEVERDDGAVVRLRGPAPGAVPHDLADLLSARDLPPEAAVARGKGSDIEAIVGLVARIYEDVPERDPASIREALDTALTPAVRSRAGVDPRTVLRICRRLDDLAERWPKLSNGGRLELAWPGDRGRV